MSNRSSKKQDDKDHFDHSNSNLVTTLNKHMNDWFDLHKGEEFITPKQFQNTYPKWDKYSNDSFRKAFYSIRKRIINGEEI